MLVEILYFEGCPHVGETVRRVDGAIAAAGVQGVSVRRVHVETEEQAEQLGFLGSPSVRVDGVDVEPHARPATGNGMRCRVYQVSGRLDGAPALEWIQAALLR